VKLLVLDLDETLISSVAVKGSLPDFESDHGYDFFIKKENPKSIFDSNYMVKKRNDLSLFLGVCYQQGWQIGIYTVAGEHYAHSVCDHLFAGLRPPLFILSEKNNVTIDPVLSRHFFKYRQDNATEFVSTGRPTRTKDLKKIKAPGFCLETTLLIDDLRTNGIRQYGNFIQIPEFCHPAKSGIEDKALMLLSFYLGQIVHQNNFRTIEKRDWMAQAAQFMNTGEPIDFGVKSKLNKAKEDLCVR
jgi:hypothetical protein